MDEFSIIVGFEEGWGILQDGTSKLKKALNAGFKSCPFDAEESMRLYTTAFTMCAQRPPYNFAAILYDKYKEILSDYVSTAVLPSMTGASGVFLLTQFRKSWKTYKLMVESLYQFFISLDNCYYLHDEDHDGVDYPPLYEVARRCFLESVYNVIYGRIADVVIELINLERQGFGINRSLLKSLYHILGEIGVEETDIVLSFRSQLRIRL